MTQQLSAPNNSIALAGFVAGSVTVGIGFIAGLFGGGLIGLVPVLLFASLPGLLAIIFGFVGFSAANRLGGKRKDFAAAAVIFGFSPIPAWLLGTFVALGVFGI